MITILLFGLVNPGAEGPPSPNGIELLALSTADLDAKISLVEKPGAQFCLGPQLKRVFRHSGAGESVVDGLQIAGPNRIKPKNSDLGEATNDSVYPSLPGLGNDLRLDFGGSIPPEIHASSNQATLILPDPSRHQLSRIITEFAAKDGLLERLLKSYTYHQTYVLEELDAKGDVVGAFRREWDILFGDNGSRIEQIKSAPPGTLKQIFVPDKDNRFTRTAEPLLFTPDQVMAYGLVYLGHVRLDGLGTYVFSIAPTRIKPNHIYFQGTIWVHDLDLQIVRMEGKDVPDIRDRKEEYIFPRFKAFREKVDGRYWFPSTTVGDDVLVFSAGPVRVRTFFKYSNFRRFRSQSRILMRESSK